MLGTGASDGSLQPTGESFPRGGMVGGAGGGACKLVNRLARIVVPAAGVQRPDMPPDLMKERTSWLKRM